MRDPDAPTAPAPSPSTPPALSPLDATPEELRALLADPFFTFRTRPHPGFEHVSPELASLLGVDPTALAAEPDLLLRLTHPDDRRAMAQALAGVLAAGPVTVRVSSVRGGQRWLEVYTRPRLGADGAPDAVLGVVRDQTAHVRGFERQRVAEGRLAWTLEETQQALFEWDIGADVLWLSPRGSHLLGLGEGTSTSPTERLLALMAGEDRGRMSRDLQEVAAGLVRSIDRVVRMDTGPRAGQSVHLVARALVDATDRPTTLRGRIEPVEGVAPPPHALRDPATQLPTLALLHDRLDRAWRAARDGGFRDGFAILLLSLEGPERAEAWDETAAEGVAAVARRLELVFPRHQTLAYTSGGELIGLLEGVQDGGEVARLARLIQARLAGPLRFGAHTMQLSTHIGAALSHPRHTRAEDVLDDARQALRRCRQQGPNTMRLEPAALHEETDRRQRLVSRVQLAMEEDGLAWTTRRCLDLRRGGPRAHLGWPRLPTRSWGVLETADLLDLAGPELAPTLLRAWLRRVLATAAPSTPGVMCLPPRAALELGLPTLVETELGLAGLGPEHLRVLVPADAGAGLPGGPEELLLARLRAMGVGTGLTGVDRGGALLSRLDTLPLDEVWLAPGAVARLCGGPPRARAVLTSLVGLAGALGIDVVATGVDDPDDLARLHTLGLAGAVGAAADAALLP